MPAKQINDVDSDYNSNVVSFYDSPSDDESCNLQYFKEDTDEDDFFYGDDNDDVDGVTYDSYYGEKSVKKDAVTLIPKLFRNYF